MRLALRFCSSVLALIISAICAYAQSNAITGAPPFTGTALTTTGVNFSVNGPLYRPSGDFSTQAAPFSVAFWVKNTFAGLTVENLVQNSSNTSNVGWQLLYRTNNAPFSLTFNTIGNTASCTFPGKTCTKDALINDGNWHHVCVNYTANSVVQFVDGYKWDQNLQATSFAANTFWLVVGNGDTPGTSMRDIYITSGVTFTPAYCAQLYQMGIQSSPLRPSSVPVPLFAHWPLDNCTGSGATFQCPDTSGNSRTLISDLTPPVATILTPSAGTVSGNVSATGSCTDTIGVTSAFWTVDGTNVSGSITASPYSYTWNSLTVADGVHNLVLRCVNVQGVQGPSSAVALTTSNGLTVQAWFFSPTGTHGNSCKTSALACPLTDQAAAAGTRQYIDGDTINIDAGHGTALITTSALQVCGPGSTACTPNAYNGALGITVQSYGGAGGCTVLAGTLGTCATVQLDPSSTLTNPVLFAGMAKVTLQNMKVVCGIAAALTDGPGKGVYWINSVSGASFTMTNVQTQDCSNDTFIHAFSGSVALNFSNLFFTGASTSATVDFGLFGEGTITGTVNNSVCSNIGGHPNTAPGFAGGGEGSCSLFRSGNIVTPNSSNTLTIQDSVGFNLGGNNNNCGGPAIFWEANYAYLTYQFDEGYNMQPISVTTGCDWDFFDHDQGAQSNTEQYSYGHNNAGNCMVFFNATPAGQLQWGNNVDRYNICENNGFPTGTPTTSTGSPGMATSFAQTGTNSSFYGNTVYSTLSTLATGANGCWNYANADVVQANNLCYSTASNTYLLTQVVVSTPITNMTLLTNVYYAPSNTTRFANVASATYATLGAFQSATGKDAGSITSNPLLTTPGGGGTIYAGTGVPAAPQPAPAAYNLQNNTSPAIGMGTNPTTWSQTATRDYYGTSVPNGVSSGWNAGSDGAHH